MAGDRGFMSNPPECGKCGNFCYPADPCTVCGDGKADACLCGHRETAHPRAGEVGERRLPCSPVSCKCTVYVKRGEQ